MPVVPLPNPSIPVYDIVEKVRRELYSMRRGEINVLDGTVGVGDTTVTLADAMGGIVKQAYIGVEDELMLVRSTSGQVAIVFRGMFGTTQVAHADGALVEVSPRFTRGDILDRMREEILSWPKDLYRVGAADVISVSDAGVRGYDLDIGDYYDILEVRRSPLDATSQSWTRVRHFEVVRNLPTADFASGQALILKENPYSSGASTTSRISVTYAAAFDTTAWSEQIDLGANGVGLEESMLDVLQYGTTWRVASTREIVRTDIGVQGEPRVKDEVPPMHSTNAAQYIKKIRDDRLAEEIDKLRRRWGIRQA